MAAGAGGVSTRVRRRAQRCELCRDAWQMPDDLLCSACAELAEAVDDALLAEMDAREQGEAA